MNAHLNESRMTTGTLPRLTTCVVEAAGGVFRTVMGLWQSGELLVVLNADNPLLPLLKGHVPVRVIQADGRAYDAIPHEGSAHALASAVVGAARERLETLRQSTAAPQVFRLVLGTLNGPEPMTAAPRT